MQGVKKLVLLLVLTALIGEEAVQATDHAVGGSQGWDQSTDFSSWASGQTFKVGDKLVFKYSTMHSVVELGSESAYKSCDIGSAVDSKNGGNTVVKLDNPGTRYFACGTMGHCGQGMKVKITTVSTDSTSSSKSTPSSTSAASDFLPPFAFSSSVTVLMVFPMFFTMM